MLQRLFSAVLYLLFCVCNAEAQGTLSPSIDEMPVIIEELETGLIPDDILEAIRLGQAVDWRNGWEDYSVVEISYFLSGEYGSNEDLVITDAEICDVVRQQRDEIKADNKAVLSALAERYGSDSAWELQATRPWVPSLPQDTRLLGDLATRLLSQAEVINAYDDVVLPTFCVTKEPSSLRIDGRVGGTGALLAVAMIEDMPSEDRPEWALVPWDDLRGEPDEVVFLVGQEETTDDSSVAWRLPPSNDGRRLREDGVGLNWKLWGGAQEYGWRRDLQDAVFRILQHAEWTTPPDIYIDDVFAPNTDLDLSERLLGDVYITRSVFDTIDLFRSTFVDLDVRDTSFGLLSLDSSQSNSIDLQDVSYLANPDRTGRQEIDLDYINAKYVNVDGVQGGRQVTVDADSMQPTGETAVKYLEIGLYEAEIQTWFDLQNVRLKLIGAEYMRVGGSTFIENTEIAEYANFSRSSFHSFEMKEVSLPSAPEGEYGMLNLGEISVRAELQLLHVTARDIYAAKTIAKVIRTTFLQVGDLLSLWGAEAELILLGLTSVKQTSFGTLKADNLDLYASDRFWTGELISGLHMDVRHLEVRNAQLEEISIGGLRREVAMFYCTSVTGQFSIMRNTAHEVFLNRVNATTLDIRRSRMASLYFAREELELTELPQDILAENPADTGTDEVTEATKKDIDKEVSCSWPDAPHGVFSQIWLEGSDIRTLRLNGVIEEALYAPRMRVDKLAFAGDRARLGANAVVNLHQATVGSIALPQGRLRHHGDTAPRLWIDGAEIGIVRIYDPNRDGGMAFASDPLRPGYWPITKSPADMIPFGRADYETMLHEELLPALSLAAAERTAENYSGAIYQFLRRSMEDAGFPGLARDVAIMQNDHYAQALGRGEGTLDAITGALLRQIYRLGKFINRYGYDNGRAVLWLFSLWAMGVIILSFEVRRKRRSAQLRFFPPAFAPWWPTLFLSADRTIPTLGIDENFSRPAHSDGRAAHHLAAVTVLLYSQRLFAFVIVIFMVGGVLDVFQ